MKVTGKNPRMFIGDKEIEGCTSFSLESDPHLPEELLFPRETLVFNGVYDPLNETQLKDYEAFIAGMGTEIAGTIHSYDGETREARLKISYYNGVISCEPVDEEIREWVKGWMRKGEPSTC